MKTQNTMRIMAMTAMAVLVLSSCGTKQAKEAEDLETVTKEEAFEGVTTYPIPTSFEVVQLINQAGASYILSICNPADNVSKYFTEKAKALNLGIYGADLAYSTTYQMKQETMNYLKTSKKLIDELNINTGFNRQLAERVDANIDNKDSLILIITDSFYDSYKYLVENGKDNLSLMVITGSWVEGVYITSQIAITSRNNTEFVKILANQKAPLAKLVELMQARSAEPEIAELVNTLKPIVDIYNGVQGETLTNEQFEAIVENITKIRNSLV
ncbi:MAG: hypothetical protein H6536_04265 [Bacteroidales bacterium]|nr:hypothetical protein [Bacteroidales bacterium]